MFQNLDTTLPWYASTTYQLPFLSTTPKNILFSVFCAVNLTSEVGSFPEMTTIAGFFVTSWKFLNVVWLCLSLSDSDIDDLKVWDWIAARAEMQNKLRLKQSSLLYSGTRL